MININVKINIAIAKYKPKSNSKSSIVISPFFKVSIINMRIGIKRKNGKKNLAIDSLIFFKLGLKV
jgi:hypothetical protein